MEKGLRNDELRLPYKKMVKIEPAKIMTVEFREILSLNLKLSAVVKHKLGLYSVR